uniref:Uncharacterized protein n=1 Tax=Panagrolaimus sp. JU765 TaxID=591449 RepID=A0AC34QEA2_9BILA
MINEDNAEASTSEENQNESSNFAFPESLPIPNTDYFDADGVYHVDIEDDAAVTLSPYQMRPTVSRTKDDSFNKFVDRGVTSSEAHYLIQNAYFAYCSAEKANICRLHAEKNGTTCEILQHQVTDLQMYIKTLQNRVVDTSSEIDKARSKQREAEEKLEELKMQYEAVLKQKMSAVNENREAMKWHQEYEKSQTVLSDMVQAYSNLKEKYSEAIKIASDFSKAKDDAVSDFQNLEVELKRTELDYDLRLTNSSDLINSLVDLLKKNSIVLPNDLKSKLEEICGGEVNVQEYTKHASESLMISNNQENTKVTPKSSKNQKNIRALESMASKSRENTCSPALVVSKSQENAYGSVASKSQENTCSSESVSGSQEHTEYTAVSGVFNTPAPRSDLIDDLALSDSSDDDLDHQVLQVFAENTSTIAEESRSAIPESLSADIDVDLQSKEPPKIPNEPNPVAVVEAPVFCQDNTATTFKVPLTKQSTRKRPKKAVSKPVIPIKRPNLRSSNPRIANKKSNEKPLSLPTKRKLQPSVEVFPVAAVPGIIKPAKPSSTSTIHGRKCRTIREIQEENKNKDKREIIRNLREQMVPSQPLPKRATASVLRKKEMTDQQEQEKQ